MCYYIAIHLTRTEIEERFQIEFDKGVEFTPNYFIPAFELPYVPVITTTDPDKISLSQWGLIPHWVKDMEYANQIRYKTFNARVETLFTKPSYKKAIQSQRCLVIASGFFEWHTHQSKKYPFFIRVKDMPLFTLAGIYDNWVDKMSGEIFTTFSVVTTEANALMKKIHNTKQRMPVVLTQEEEKNWLDPNLTEKDISGYLGGISEDAMDAYPVSRLITKRDVEKNTPESIKPHIYSELKNFKYMM